MNLIITYINIMIPIIFSFYETKCSITLGRLDRTLIETRFILSDWMRDTTDGDSHCQFDNIKIEEVDGLFDLSHSIFLLHFCANISLGSEAGSKKLYQ